MPLSTKWKIVVCVKILVGLCNAVASPQEMFRDMSVDERRSFFGTKDGSELDVVKMPESSRQKRDVCSCLKITFTYDHAITTTSVNLVDDQQALISDFWTSVWFADSNRQAHHNVQYTPKSDILSRIGKFDFFQNKDECSAVVRVFKPSGEIVMIGVLKHDFTVKSVRDNESGFQYIDGSGSVESIHRRSTNYQDDNSPLYLAILRHNGTRNLENLLHDTVGPSFPSEQLSGMSWHTTAPFTPPSVVFPKLLISPDYGLVAAQKSVEDFLTLLIAQLNAVDMMYRQLPDPDVRLRIGGSSYRGATPYIAQDTATSLSGSLRALTVLDDVKVYFTDESHRFNVENYAAIVVLTGSHLYSDDKEQIQSLAGMAIESSACYTGRTVVNYENNFFGVMTMAHELAHVFGALHDGAPENTCSNIQGYTMVTGNYLAMRLKWSPCSENYLSKFFKSWEARCTHERSPTVVPPGLGAAQKPGVWLSGLGQCDNLMTGARGYCVNSCLGSLGCRDRPGSHCDSWFNRPLDGTDVNGNRCVNGQLVVVITHIMKTGFSTNDARGK